MDLKLPIPEEYADRFDGLYQYLSRKYNLQVSEYGIENLIFRIYGARNIDELVEELILKDPDDVDLLDERLPYFAEMWPAALALSRYLLRAEVVQKGTTVLELGCGLGLAGIVAGHFGGNVLETDYQPDALRLTELNWLINRGQIPATALMDWRHPEIESKFEVILASDVVYEKRFFWPLIDTIRLLLAPGGHVFISEPNRTLAKDFFKILEQESFVMEQHVVPVHFRERDVNVSVYNISRNK